MKDILRKNLIKKRKNISHSEVLNKSKLIEKKLFKIDEFRFAKNILFYVSYNNEVFTHNMIKKSLSMNKNVITPISYVKKRNLILIKIDKWDELKKGSYNILEPIRTREKEILLDSIDFIIVPAIGFDLKGNRIGHGLGYYDRLLKKSKNATHIGLAFEFQIMNQIKVEEYDIPVNIIITEKRIIYCR